MEKVIKLVMNKDKSISINVDNKEKCKINQDNRSINAEILFNIFDFKIGNTYKVEKENPKNIDEKVLEFFYELIKDISSKVNNIRINDEDKNED